MHRRLVVALALAAVALAACGNSDGDVPEIVEQTNSYSAALFSELDGMYPDNPVPRDVGCIRPKSERFVCSVYVEVRDGVALFAEYAVTPCEGRGFRARLRSAPDWLLERMPDHFRSFDCGYVEPSPD